MNYRARLGCLGLVAVVWGCGSPDSAGSARVDADIDTLTADTVRPVVVFESRRNGYHTFRIPALVSLPTGSLLAFAEGRTDSAADNGNVDVVLRRSFDAGRSWGPLQGIADNADGVVGNPAPVVDRRSGDVILFTTRNPIEDPLRRSVWLQRSSDAGLTWSEAVDITSMVSRARWRWYATGPGHGIQLSAGPYRGRLIVAAAHTVEHDSVGRRRGFHLLLSDDGGRSWRIGASLEDSGWIEPSEAAVAELPGGRVIVNVRDQGGTSPATRAAARSDDGGTTFSQGLRSEDQLLAPVVHASLLGLPTGLVIFIAPSHPTRRRRLQIRIASAPVDRWTERRVVWPLAAGYSDVALVDSQTLGVLFESGVQDTREAIRFAQVPIDFDHRATIVTTRSRARSAVRP